jgi:hypothetical protein
MRFAQSAFASTTDEEADTSNAAGRTSATQPAKKVCSSQQFGGRAHRKEEKKKTGCHAEPRGKQSHVVH